MYEKRCMTGIAKLDEILNGGIPRGHTVLISGDSGTGKTILCEEILFNGAKKHGENGVYITMTEPVFKTLKNLEGLKYYEKSLVDGKKVNLLSLKMLADMLKIKDESQLFEKQETLMNAIEEVVEATDAKRLAIDSITAICYNLREEVRIRKFIFELGTILAGLDCTTLMTSEVPADRAGYSVFGVEEFISDGILKLDRSERKGALLRTLQIVKMRGIQHSVNRHVMDILPEGVQLMPMMKAYTE